MRRESRSWFSVKFYPIAQFSNFILKEFLKGLVGVKNLLSNACQRSAFVVPTDATGKLSIRKHSISKTGTCYELGNFAF